MGGGGGKGGEGEGGELDLWENSFFLRCLVEGEEEEEEGEKAPLFLRGLEKKILLTGKYLYFLRSSSPSSSSSSSSSSPSSLLPPPSPLSSPSSPLSPSSSSSSFSAHPSSLSPLPWPLSWEVYQEVVEEAHKYASRLLLSHLLLEKRMMYHFDVIHNLFLTKSGFLFFIVLTIWK